MHNIFVNVYNQIILQQNIQWKRNFLSPLIQNLHKREEKYKQKI